MPLTSASQTTAFEIRGRPANDNIYCGNIYRFLDPEVYAQRGRGSSPSSPCSSCSVSSRNFSLAPCPSSELSHFSSQMYTTFPWSRLAWPSLGSSSGWPLGPWQAPSGDTITSASYSHTQTSPSLDSAPPPPPPPSPAASWSHRQSTSSRS